MTDGIRNGATTRIASFLCALTQFLGASDLCQLDRVSLSDHLALDGLWNTCDSKCKGQLPVQELRSGHSNPRDTAYLWSVAHARVMQWTQKLEVHGLREGSVSQSFMLHPHGCMRCDRGVNQGHNSEYVVEVRWSALKLSHFIGSASDEHLVCPHLQRIWFDATGILPTPDQSSKNYRFHAQGPMVAPTSIPTTLLRVLIALAPQMRYTFVSKCELFQDAFIDLWVTLGVLPHIPVCTSMLTHIQQDQLVQKWKSAVELIHP
jgi:hypothetical protein